MIRIEDPKSKEEMDKQRDEWIRKHKKQGVSGEDDKSEKKIEKK